MLFRSDVAKYAGLSKQVPFIDQSSLRFKDYDVSIYLAPALVNEPHAVAAAWSADAALLVLESGKTRRSDTKLAIRQLDAAGLPVAAFLILDVSRFLPVKPIFSAKDVLYGRSNRRNEDVNSKSAAKTINAKSDHTQHAPGS